MTVRSQQWPNSDLLYCKSKTLKAVIKTTKKWWLAAPNKKIHLYLWMQSTVIPHVTSKPSICTQANGLWNSRIPCCSVGSTWWPFKEVMQEVQSPVYSTDNVFEGFRNTRVAQVLDNLLIHRPINRNHSWICPLHIFRANFVAEKPQINAKSICKNCHSCAVYAYAVVWSMNGSYKKMFFSLFLRFLFCLFHRTATVSLTWKVIFLSLLRGVFEANTSCFIAFCLKK